MVCACMPASHFCMGGLAADADARVLAASSSASSSPGGAAIVPGLFAAGECVGGVHGANRLAGNGLLGSLVFGLIAGRAAAAAAAAGSAAECQPQVQG